MMYIYKNIMIICQEKQSQNTVNIITKITTLGLYFDTGII